MSIGVNKYAEGPGTRPNVTRTRNAVQDVEFSRSVYRSAANSSLKVRRIPIPFHCYLGEGTLDVTEIVRRQFDASRSDILLKTLQLRGSGDRNDPRLLRQ